MDGGRIAAAVIGGYLLGRTKKMKLAIMVGGALMGKKIPTDPTQLLKLAGSMVEKSPELQRLDTAVRGRLMEAGKDAALAVASSRMEALTDNLVNRVETLGKPVGDTAQAAGDAVGGAGSAVGGAAGSAGTAVTSATNGVGSTASGLAGKRRGKRAPEDEPPEDDVEEVADAEEVDDEDLDDADAQDAQDVPAPRNGTRARTGRGSRNGPTSRNGSGRPARRKAVAND